MFFYKYMIMLRYHQSILLIYTSCFYVLSASLKVDSMRKYSISCRYRQEMKLVYFRFTIFLTILQTKCKYNFVHGGISVFPWQRWSGCGEYLLGEWTRT